MKPELMDAVFNLMLAMAKTEATPDQKPEANHRPEYILCDEIWDILAEAGHGCEIIIHKENPETLYYDDFASQTDNVHFMNHLSEAMDNGYLVTVNGTDIFDLY